MDFRIYDDDVMRFKDRVCVPDLLELKKNILEERHKSGLSIQTNVMKMYKELKKMFWWAGMKMDVVEFLNSCLTCHKYKIEHYKLSRLMQPLIILD